MQLARRRAQISPWQRLLHSFDLPSIPIFKYHRPEPKTAFCGLREACARLNAASGARTRILAALEVRLEGWLLPSRSFFTSTFHRSHTLDQHAPRLHAEPDRQHAPCAAGQARARGAPQVQPFRQVRVCERRWVCQGELLPAPSPARVPLATVRATGNPDAPPVPHAIAHAADVRPTRPRRTGLRSAWSSRQRRRVASSPGRASWSKRVRTHPREYPAVGPTASSSAQLTPARCCCRSEWEYRHRARDGGCDQGLPVHHHYGEAPPLSGSARDGR